MKKTTHPFTLMLSCFAFVLLLILTACQNNFNDENLQNDFEIDGQQQLLPGSLSGLPDIVIDGNASEWQGIAPLVTERRQSARSLSVTHNQTYIYFCIKGRRMGPYYSLFINTDNNTATGYQGSPWGSAGFDYLVENGILYRSLGSGWDWESLGTLYVLSAANSRVVEIAVDYSVFTNLANTITMGFIDIKNDWSIKSMLPKEAPLPGYTINPEETEMKVMVPAYFYPGPYWDELATQASLMPGRLLAIANPNSGPGESADPNYIMAIDNLRASQGLVIGYVYTGYGNRPLIEVKNEIDRWYQFYSIDGIFLDEQANTSGKEAYYQELYNYIKTLDNNSLVVGNPGTDTIETYLFYQENRVTDILCIFETGSGFLSWQPLAWCSGYNRDNFCVLPYNTSQNEYSSYVDYAAAKNTGWIYCTDDDLPNPWDTLPGYFDDFCSYIIGTY